MKTITAFLKSHWKSSDVADTQNPLTVNSCGYEKFITQDMEIFREKGRVDYHLIYIVDGKGCFWFDSNPVDVEKGNIVIYTPGQSQHFKYSFKDFTEVYWIHFTGYAAGDYLSGCGLSDSPVHYIGVDNDCIGLIRKIIHELQFKEPMYEYCISARLLELFSIITRKKLYLSDKNRCILDDDIRRTIETMHMKHDQKLPVDFYAKLCNLSLFRFNHKFKAMTGMTPLEYIRQIRMDKAKYLISNTAFSVSEISALVGYDDPLYFSRVFKKHTGFSPLAYKKANS